MKTEDNQIIRLETNDYPPICGFSLRSFKPAEESNMFAYNYIYEHCKHWGFFGDGLCFTCDCEEKICPFNDVSPENLPSDEILEKHGRKKK